ncbi:MAG: FecR domain-containing protein [Prolixibacteraceae bacterium]
MRDKPNYKTLLDFSKGKYSYNDYLKVKDWFTQTRDDKETESRLFGQWKAFAGTEMADDDSLRSLFARIHYKVLREEKMNEKKRNLWHWYRQVAAILIPVITITAVLYFFAGPVFSPGQSWVELSVPEGARIEFMLPDSTSGWLNSGAKLKYPPVFGKHRQVELTGEAFFKVSHRRSSDFTVSVPDMDIRVLGTQFNVSAYADETVSQVVLKEGRIEVSGKAGQFSQVLQQNEKLLYNGESKSFKVTKVDADLYKAWTDGYLVINNEPMAQVEKKLERWYNVEITIRDEKLKGMRFKGTFNGEPLEEVLRFIAMTTPVVYTIERNGYDSKGVLTKRQIIMKLK